MVRESKLASYNKEVLKRIDAIEQLDQETKNKLFFLIDMIKRIKEVQNLNSNDKNTIVEIIDAYIRDAKTRKAYA